MPFEQGRCDVSSWSGRAARPCCRPPAPRLRDLPFRSPRATPKIEAKTPDTKLEAPSPEFARYLETLWPKAQARGVSRATFDLAFQGVTPDPKVAVVGRAQSEFAQPISAYLDGAVSGGASGAAASLPGSGPRRSTPSRRSTACRGRSSSQPGAWRATSAATRARPPSSGRSRPSRFTASAPATSSAS